MPASLAALGYLILGFNLLLESRDKAKGGHNGSGLPGMAGTERRLDTGRRFNAFMQGLDSGVGRRRAPVQVIDSAPYAAESPLLRRPAQGKVENVQSLSQRVQRIRKLIRKGAVDPAIRKLAGAVVARRNLDGTWAVPEKDWRGEAVAMFNFVRANVRYTRDSAFADTYVHPARTLFDRANPKKAGSIGDCDDYTITLGALLAAIGHTPEIRVVAAKNGDDEKPDWNHIYLRDRLPAGGAIAGAGGEIITLDASVNKPAGWEVPKERIYRVKDFQV